MSANYFNLGIIPAGSSLNRCQELLTIDGDSPSLGSTSSGYGTCRHGARGMCAGVEMGGGEGLIKNL